MIYAEYYIFFYISSGYLAGEYIFAQNILAFSELLK